MSPQRSVFYGLLLGDRSLECALRSLLNSQGFVELSPQYFTETMVCLYDHPEAIPTIGQGLLLTPSLHRSKGTALQLPVRFSVLTDTMRHLCLKALKALSWHFPGGEIFSPLNQRITWGNREIVLTEKESLLLETLCENAQGQSRDVLLHQVWKYASSVESHTIESHLYRLRKKLLEVSFGVEQVNGGYSLSLPPKKEVSSSLLGSS